MRKRTIALLLCALFALASVTASADTRWICPLCFHPNTTAYCSECGVGRPQYEWNEGYLYKYDECEVQAPFTMRSGSSGDSVKSLQDMLNYLGYFNSAIDGDYGPKTKAAVAAYKQNNGMSGHANNDGICTPFAYLKLFISAAAADSAPSVTRYSISDDEIGILTGSSISMGQYTYTLDFSVRNKNKSQVLTGFAIRSWLVDSKGNVIKQNGYECYETVYTSVEIDPDNYASFRYNLPDYSSASKAYALRWIVIDSAYGNGETYAQYDLSGSLTGLPYYETLIY